MSEEVISGSRWKSVLFAAACAALVGVAVSLLRWPPSDLNPAIAWGMLIVCGFVGAPVFVILAMRPQQLILRADGFEHVGPFGARKTVGWHEVAEFLVWRFEYSAHVAYRPRDPREAAILSLGGGWQGGSKKVVEALNRHRQATV
jgi:hypothetical protein